MNAKVWYCMKTNKERRNGCKKKTNDRRKKKRRKERYKKERKENDIWMMELGKEI